MQIIKLKSKIIAVVIMLFLLPVNIFIPAQIAQAYRVSIVIDPGHGGRDTGAIGLKGLKEKTVNLKVALRLRKYLLADGVKVIMTRSTDKYVSLSKRVAIANKSGADRFISIHHNSYGKKRRVNGTETYIKRRAGSSVKNLGKLIQHALSSSLRLNSRGLKRANFYVITYTKIPAILTEGSFISNSREEALLRTNKRINEEAKGIYNGLRKHMNLRGLKDGLAITGTAESAQELYFPNVIDRKRVWHSLIPIMNTSSSANSVQIKLINPAGSIIKQFYVGIRPKSRYLLVPRKVLRKAFNGAVTVSASGNSITGYLSQSKPGGGIIGMSQAVTPFSSMSFPRVTDTAKSWRSMVSVMNTSDSSIIDITADFYSRGKLTGTKVLHLKPLQNYDFYPRRVLRRDFSGIVKLSSAAKFTSVMTQANVDGETLGLMSGIANRSKMAFPYVNDDRSTYKSNITMCNASEETAVFDVQLRDSKGSLKKDFIVNLSPGSNYGFSPRRKISRDFNGSVVISSPKDSGSASLMMLNKDNTALGLVEPQTLFSDSYYSFVQDNSKRSTFISVKNMSSNSGIINFSLFSNPGKLLKTYSKTYGSFTGSDYSPYSINQKPFTGPAEISGNSGLSSVMVVTN